jgi:hypothetical protein
MLGITVTRPSPSQRSGRLRADAGSPGGGLLLPAISSDEMSSILLSCGAQVVGRTDHGQLFALRRRLIFLRHSHAVAANDLHDVLRSASIPPGMLGGMLTDLRSPKGPPVASESLVSAAT